MVGGGTERGDFSGADFATGAGVVVMDGAFSASFAVGIALLGADAGGDVVVCEVGACEVGVALAVLNDRGELEGDACASVADVPVSDDDFFESFLEPDREASNSGV